MNLHRRTPGWLLAQELADSPAWHEHVRAFKEGTDPQQIARLYVPRASARRDVIQTMLRRAAEVDADQMPSAMAPVVLLFDDAPARSGDRQRWIRGHPDGPVNERLRRGDRRNDEWDLWTAGARMVALRGARACLTCGTPLSVTHQRPRRFYCFRCEATTSEAQRRYDQRAMTTVLDRALDTLHDL